MPNEKTKPECIGNCRLCDSLGICPGDKVCCEDCGTELEQGEGIEVEVETVERGRHGSKMITVCPECFGSMYQGEEITEWDI